MRFVAHHKIPAAVRHFELGLYIGITRELVEASNPQIVFEELVSGTCGF